MTTQALGTDLAAMRRLNDHAVLTTLWDSTDPLTATQLATATGLSRTTIETVLTGLMDADLVDSELLRPTRAGRPARGYRFAADRGVTIGIDVGPHGISGVAGDLRGDPSAAHRRLEGDLSGGEQAATAVISMVRRLLAESDTASHELAALSVGIPGIVDADGRPAKTTVVPDWLTTDIDTQLRKAFPGSRITFDNDTKLAALAEVQHGTVGEDETAVLLRVGNRISAASIIDGRVARGAHGAAGEIGALGRVAWPEAQQRFAKSLSDGAAKDESIASFAADVADGLGALVLAVDPHVVVVSTSHPGTSSRLAATLQTELAGRSLFLPDVRTSELGQTAPRIGALAVSSSAVREHLFTREY